MWKISNVNNLNEYLKKTEAEKIYMKKINSINMSFTSLLTSIQSVFSTYDYQLSTLNNAITNINVNTSNLNNSLISVSNSFTNYTFNHSNIDGEISSIKSNTSDLYVSFTDFRSSVNVEISSLWDAIGGGGDGGDYNFFKEFAKESQNIYTNFDNQHLILDNEQFEFIKTNLNSFTMINPNKKEYVFCSNILNSSDSNIINLGGEYSRLGLKIPGDSTASVLTDAIPQNFIQATVNSVYIYQDFHYSNFNSNNSISCLKAYLCNDGIDKSKAFWSISPNLNAKTINLYNYKRNNIANTYSQYNLNERVEMIDGLTGNYTPYFSLSRVSQDITNMKVLTFTGFDTTTNINVNIRGPKENGYCIGPVNIPNCNMTLYQKENLDFTGNNYSITLSNTGQNYTATLNSNASWNNLLSFNVYSGVNIEMPSGISSGGVNLSVDNGNSTITFNIDSWNFSRATLNAIPYLNFVNNTLLSGSIGNNDTTKKLNLTLSNNLLDSLLVEGNQAGVLSINNNTITNLTVSNYLSGGGVSFGENFRNSNLSISCSVGNTYYSYNNPDATVYLPQGKQKLDYFTAGECNISAGPGIEVAVFSTLNISAMMGTFPYVNGGWKYVWANNLNLTNANVFYSNMLLQDYAFFHCPFIQLGTNVLNDAINQNGVLSHEHVLVDNAPTTSINLHLTGNYTSVSVNPQFIHDQKYILKADIRGWNPTRILSFDQLYLFDNVASEYASLNDKFTAIVDNTADWNNYKMFFNPFGTPDENRISFDTA